VFTENGVFSLTKWGVFLMPVSKSMECGASHTIAFQLHIVCAMTLSLDKCKTPGVGLKAEAMEIRVRRAVWSCAGPMKDQTDGGTAKIKSSAGAGNLPLTST
jgi:hypothetical protein